MKKIELKSLLKFCESKYFSMLDEKSLCVIDVDGIFFHGLTDPHFWFAKIKKEYLENLEKIAKTKTNIWIFTDRNLFGFWGPFKKQLCDTLSENGKIVVRKYKNSRDFLKKEKTLFRAIILNAQKPRKDSRKIIQKALAEFEKVIYIASHDTPINYDDETLVESLENDTINLYFIDIRK